MRYIHVEDSSVLSEVRGKENQALPSVSNYYLRASCCSLQLNCCNKRWWDTSKKLQDKRIFYPDKDVRAYTI